ncbi:MAG: hypothetical protein Q9216_001990 [Gyalolechia sp. 2 TL-2023]
MRMVIVVTTIFSTEIGEPLREPGGFIQWSEQDPTTNRIVVAPGVPRSSQATKEVLSFLTDLGLMWVSELGDHLGRHAKLVAFDRYRALNEHQLRWSIGVLQACEEFASNLDRNSRGDEDAERAAGLRNAAESASVEMLNGVGIYSELVVAVAQKDTSSLSTDDSASTL